MLRLTHSAYQVIEPKEEVNDILLQYIYRELHGSVYITGTCFIQKIYAPSSSLLNKHLKQGFQRWPVPGTFTRLRSCIVPVEITEPPKISGGQNHKYDGR